MEKNVKKKLMTRQTDVYESICSTPETLQINYTLIYTLLVYT